MTSRGCRFHIGFQVRYSLFLENIFPRIARITFQASSRFTQEIWCQSNCSPSAQVEKPWGCCSRPRPSHQLRPLCRQHSPRYWGTSQSWLFFSWWTRSLFGASQLLKTMIWYLQKVTKKTGIYNLLSRRMRKEKFQLYFPYPKNHWTLLWRGLTLYRRVLGSPNHQLWDPMILREVYFPYMYSPISFLQAIGWVKREIFRGWKKRFRPDILAMWFYDSFHQNTAGSRPHPKSTFHPKWWGCEFVRSHKNNRDV